MILSVIEKLSSLDQTSTELFRDILVKYGPQLEDDNPGKMHIPYSRHFFFLNVVPFICWEGAFKQLIKGV